MSKEFVNVVMQPDPIGKELQIHCSMMPEIRATIGKFTLPNAGQTVAIGIRSPYAQEVACFDEPRLTTYIEELQKALADIQAYNKARVN